MKSIRWDDVFDDRFTSTNDSRLDADVYSVGLIEDFFSVRSDVDDVIAAGAGIGRSVAGDAS